MFMALLHYLHIGNNSHSPLSQSVSRAELVEVKKEVKCAEKCWGKCNGLLPLAIYNYIDDKMQVSIHNVCATIYIK